MPKIELPAQEKTIQKGEKLLPFSQRASKELDSVFKANGTSGRMSVSQLKKALGVLDLDPTVFTDPDTQVYKFLSRLKNEKLYDIKKVTLCAILVGEGDTSTKARILFNHFDVDASDKMDKKEIRHLLEETLEITLKLIPSLALKERLRVRSRETSRRLCGHRDEQIAGRRGRNFLRRVYSESGPR
jgi:Ca2+-binding EF-hand superfamily protein